MDGRHFMQNIVNMNNIVGQPRDRRICLTLLPPIKLWCSHDSCRNQLINWHQTAADKRENCREVICSWSITLFCQFVCPLVAEEEWCTFEPRIDWISGAIFWVMARGWRRGGAKKDELASRCPPGRVSIKLSVLCPVEARLIWMSTMWAQPLTDRHYSDPHTCMRGMVG